MERKAQMEYNANPIAAALRTTPGLGQIEPLADCTMAVRPMSTEEIAEQHIRKAHDRLDYHAPSRDQLPRFQNLRDAAKNFATVVIRNCPQFSDDTRQALGCVEAALMTANKAIALENTPK